MKKSKLQHDLKQPLTTLRTFIHHLPKKIEDPDFMRDFYQFSKQALDRFETIIEHIGEKEDEYE